MPQVILFLVLLTAYGAALQPNSQQPLTGSIAPSEIQPYPLGLYDSNKQWPDQYACTTGHVRAFSNRANGQYISALLTFKYPSIKYKYCWLEFNPPAPLKGDGRVMVRPFSPALPCPAPSSIVRGDPLGFLVIPAKGGNATWEDRSGNTLNWPMRSKCPEQAGTTQGIEIVPPQGVDFDLVWSQKSKGEGVRLMYSN
ncbi:hypothetical protein B0H67DRAFT_572638 [Lasiosphaeris hirsuta]|uniref:Uncharacterized protein n=1 Tax=Lasiosphaeris hirsuta TaxID=260670 RepID=A0AA40ANS4_9PEZI|nr:hypothetical protein B0H67DRAFT_572638 [Lasiosphaeris hirsuta]